VAEIGAVAVLATAPLVAAHASQSEHRGHDQRVPATLVKMVQDATGPFMDINTATRAGYGQFLGCVSSPQEGAMGVHYVNGTLVADGALDATKPEALLYEIVNGRARLMGVEFIVDSAQWHTTHQDPPVLEGQVFNLVGSPNRYGLKPFYELHVWAWRDNPTGTFSDFNPDVTCNAR
jgi:hypothetical protein